MSSWCVLMALHGLCRCDSVCISRPTLAELNPCHLDDSCALFVNDSCTHLVISYHAQDLPKLTDELQEYITTTSKQGGWSANCVQLTNAWMRDGLKPRCITRDLQWGIPVPLEGFESKVGGDGWQPLQGGCAALLQSQHPPRLSCVHAQLVLPHANACPHQPLVLPRLAYPLCYPLSSPSLTTLAVCATLVLSTLSHRLLS